MNVVSPRKARLLLSLLSAPTENGGRGCNATAPCYLQDEDLTFQLGGTGGVSLRPHPS